MWCCVVYCSNRQQQSPHSKVRCIWLSSAGGNCLNTFNPPNFSCVLRIKVTVSNKLCCPLCWRDANRKINTTFPWICQCLLAPTTGSSDSASGFTVELWPQPATSLSCTHPCSSVVQREWKEIFYERMLCYRTFLDSTKWVATPALCTSRPLRRKPVKARNSPNLPWSLGRK